MGRQASRTTWWWVTGVTVSVALASLAGGNGCAMADEALRGGDDDDEVGGGPTTSASGSGGGGGENAGGAPPLTANPEEAKSDDCNPPSDLRPWDIGVGTIATLSGNTADLADDYSSFCGGGAAGERNDVVYFVRSVDRGTLTLSAASSADQPVVYVEEECGVRSTFGLPPDQLPCMDTAGQQIRLGIKAQQDLFIIVEGGGADGDYLVDVEVTAPICGDGIINPANDPGAAEHCDFGPSGAGGAGGGADVPNGCDENCRFEDPATGEDQCPGVNIDTQLGQPIASYTVGFTDDYQPVCAAPGGPDRFYAVGMQQGEQLQVSVVADFDVVLALMTVCGEALPIHCQDSSGWSKEETLDFTAPAAGTYYLVVDGYDDVSWGSFTLTVTKS